MFEQYWERKTFASEMKGGEIGYFLVKQKAFIENRNVSIKYTQQKRKD